MRKLIHILLLFLPLSLGAAYFWVDKKDFIRTPNSNNIIVDWNLKSFTFNVPHGTTPSLRGAPDSTGYIFVKDTVGEKRLMYYIRGLGWQQVANNLIGLSDSLNNKANRNFNNVATGAITQLKVNGLPDSLAKKVNRDLSNLANASIPYSKLVPLANLTATNGSLTFSGSYNGSTARTVALNTANANNWSATQTFSAVTNPFILNGAASTAYSYVLQQNSVNKIAIGLTSGGNMVTYYYPDGITQTSAYTTNSTTGITTYQVAPVVPTQAANDNSTKAASTAYVDAAVSNAVLQIVEIAGTTQTAQAGRLYIPHSASLTTITLPSTANIGALVQVVGEGSGRWRLNHGNATDVIVGAGGFSTTAGTTHGVEASDQNGTITVRKTNTNKWTITTSQATISIY